MTVKTALDLTSEVLHHIEKHQMVTCAGIAPGYMQHLTRYDAEMLAAYSDTLSDISSWILSDLLLWIEEQVIAELHRRSGAAFWNERDRRWRQLVKLTKREYEQGTLVNMRTTAKAFPYGRRRNTTTLGFRHHRLLTSYQDDEQDYWLDMCEDLGWNAFKLEMELHSKRSDVFVPSQMPQPYIPPALAAPVALTEEVFAHHNIRFRHELPHLAVFENNGARIEVEAVTCDGLPKLEFRIKEQP